MLQDKIIEKDSHRNRNQTDHSLKHVKCLTLKADKDDLITVMKWHLAVAQIDGHLCTSLHSKAKQTLIRVGRLTVLGQRTLFQKQLCFNPLYPTAPVTQNNPEQ